jgi:AbrB family looped-hinge helix DNA binding protein
MVISTKIDAAGRVVIPKELRKRYGLESGTAVHIVPLPDGVSIIPERKQRRFLRRGPILSIDTGCAEASLEHFDVDRLREKRLDSVDPQPQP